MDLNSGSTDRILYHYTPSEAAAYTFIALFGIGSIGHVCFMFLLNAWHFTPFVLGALCEAFGYFGRLMSHNHPHLLRAFIVQNMLILSAPPMLALTIYLALSRVASVFGVTKNAIPCHRWHDRAYVAVEGLALVSQILGAGLQMAEDLRTIDAGAQIILAGLIVQLVAAMFFMFVSWRVHRHITTQTARVTADIIPSLTRYMLVLYAVNVVTIVRHTVRIVEYGQGSNGFIASHEVFIYVFDALPMTFVVLVFLVFHPGRLERAAQRGVERPPLLARLRNSYRASTASVATYRPTQRDISFIPARREARRSRSRLYFNQWRRSWEG